MTVNNFCEEKSTEYARERMERSGNMKRFLGLFLVLVLLAGCSQKEVQLPTTKLDVSLQGGTETTSPYNVYKMVFSTTLIHNNSVGNDWRFSYYYEDSPVHSGREWSIPKGIIETIPIDIVVTERDKSSDVGKAKVKVALLDGYETTTTVTVTEDKGRYARNTAQWQITCRVRRISG